MPKTFAPICKKSSLFAKNRYRLCGDLTLSGKARRKYHYNHCTKEYLSTTVDDNSRVKLLARLAISFRKIQSWELLMQILEGIESFATDLFASH